MPCLNRNQFLYLYHGSSVVFIGQSLCCSPVLFHNFYGGV